MATSLIETLRDQAFSEMDDESNQLILVSLKRVRPLFKQAAAVSLDVPEVLAMLGLREDLHTLPDDETISLSDYYRIQNRLSILFGDETCHLSERQLLPGSTDFVLRNVGECHNLCEVMQVIAESYNLLHGGAFNSVQIGRDSVDYVIDDSGFPYVFSQDTDNMYFAMECTLIFLHCMLLTVSPEHAPKAVQRLSLKRPNRDSRCRHLSYWHVPIRFGTARYKISFGLDAAMQPLPVPCASVLTSNAVHRILIEAVSDQHNATGVSTRDQVYSALLNGDVEQDAIAKEIGVSVATLRRRLGEEGVSFRQLRQEVLNETAKRLLREKRSISQVSDALGFAEFRSFNRAFKAWNGMTPKDYLISVQELPIAR